MSAPTPEDIARARAEADLLFTPGQIEAAVKTMAARITERLGAAEPLLLATMTGGLVPTALLMPHLDFPLQVDYIHVTRYGTATTGGGIQWIKPPPQTVQDRAVLIVDDLLDQGITLAAAVEECQRRGAREVLTAVLIHKEMERRPGLSRTDFHALSTPDRYLFGYGMDYKTWWRNSPGIYAVKDT